MKNLSNRAVDTSSHIHAVLGPTNTGKTHLAVERMMGHSSGMIGLPLRLLAREIYDRIVNAPSNPAGKNTVALITGEEKIIPPHARWWVCTVESMPMEKSVAFLAVDEIQLAADPERGHVFTDRLLRARGREETMFLGSEIIRPLIRRLVPDAVFSSRPRFSELTYVEPKKLSRLQRRSALITFSAANVYGYAEMIRRQKGGVAVVMGSLSPRTRNKQVELYQNGDVDFLVATDAIGMGLNMDIDHVCFASLSKFDGRRMRDLTASEVAQIAGRAGRHMNNGTFGCLTEGADYQRGMSDAMVYAVENHQFAPLTVLEWRNRALDYAHPSALIRCLEAAPERAGLTRTLENTDFMSLRRLMDDPAIRDRTCGPAALKTLWDICGIPDFLKVSHEEHVKLLGQVFDQISAENGKLSDDWLQKKIKPLERMDGGIEVLSSRLAHIRTWTYISHRSQWLEDAKYWQEHTRSLEDRLSDALHERLTQKFVNRRMSVLMRELRQKGKLMANIDSDGSIFVESHFIGTLEGFQFKEDPAAFGEDSKLLRSAADSVLADEIKKRAEEFSQCEDGELSLIFGNPLTKSTLNWRGIVIATLARGQAILTPKATVLPSSILQGDSYTLVQARIDRWLSSHIAEVLAPLYAMNEAVNGAKDADGKEMIDGMARGIAFQMVEKLGTIPRRLIARDLKEVDRDGRFQIKRLGVWLGAASLYIPALLKPAPAMLRLYLWALFNEMDRLPEIPTAGLCTIKIDEKAPRTFYEVSGYRVVGKNAVRLDMLERLANAAREVSMKGPFPTNPDLMSLVGTSGDDFVEIMGYLGYVCKEYSPEDAAKIAEKRAEKEVAAAEKKSQEKPKESEEKPAEAAATSEPKTEIEKSSEKAPEKAPEEAPKEAPEKAPKETSKETSEKAPEKAPEEASEKAVEKVPEEVVEKIPEKSPGDAGAKTSETNAGKEPEKEAEPEKIMLFSHQPDMAHRRGQNRPGAERRPAGSKPSAKFQGKPSGKFKHKAAPNRSGAKGRSQGKPVRKPAVIDPNNPFAALAGLKEQLKAKK